MMKDFEDEIPCACYEDRLMDLSWRETKHSKCVRALDKIL